MTDRKLWYRSPVTEKDVTGFSSSKNESAQPRNAAFSCAYTLVAPSMGGGGREAARLAGVLSCRSANPAIRRSPRLAAGQRFNRYEGGHHA